MFLDIWYPKPSLDANPGLVEHCTGSIESEDSLRLCRSVVESDFGEVIWLLKKRYN